MKISTRQVALVGAMAMFLVAYPLQAGPRGASMGRSGGFGGFGGFHAPMHSGFSGHMGGFHATMHSGWSGHMGEFHAPMHSGWSQHAGGFYGSMHRGPAQLSRSGHSVSPWHNPRTWQGVRPAYEHHHGGFHYRPFHYARGYPYFGSYYPFYYDSFYYGFPFYAGFYPYFPFDYPFFYWDYSNAMERADLRQLAMADMGEIKVQVKPKDAYVYVDGQLAGTAKQFDGSPGYLWLKAGTHQIAVYKDGYQTIDESVQVQPGTRIKIKEKMQPGKAVLPKGFENPSQSGDVING
jgi:hypothetical protein